MGGKLVLYEKNELVSTGVEKVLSTHFNSGLEKFSVDKSKLDEQNLQLQNYRERDDNNYTELVAREEKEFIQNQSVFKRVLGRWLRKKLGFETYHPPEKEPSLETDIYEKVVKVGTVLKEYLGNLHKFPKQFEELGKSYQILVEKREYLQSEVFRLEKKIPEYDSEIKVLDELALNLRSFPNFNAQDQEKLVNELQNKYDNIDISDENVRELFLQKVENCSFTLPQLRENDSCDLEIAQEQLSSTTEQLGKIKEYAEYIWVLYKPAKKEAVKLKCIYDSASIDAESGSMIHAVSGILENVDVLCEEVRESQDALRDAIDIKVSVAKEIQQLEERIHSLERKSLTSREEK